MYLFVHTDLNCIKQLIVSKNISLITNSINACQTIFCVYTSTYILYLVYIIQFCNTYLVNNI